MPKIKTHKGAKKRFSPVAGGKKYKHRAANRAHNTGDKPNKQVRRLRTDGAIIHSSDKNAVDRMLGRK